MKNKPKVAKIIISIMVVILLVLGGVFLRYFLALNGFLDKITEHKPEMKAYSVIVTENSAVKEINDLANKSVSFLETDNKAANAEQYLQSVVAINSGFYDDVDTLFGMLKSDITNAVVLESDRLEVLKEEATASAENTRVVYTFEIEIESEHLDVSGKEVTTEPFVVYISGSDSRVGVKATARSDVNIVAVVNPRKEKILLVSIPRDMYVQLHGTSGLRDKLTHAGIYGIDMSKTTIEDFLGINIDYTIKVSFETVVKVVDQLDGIEIESDTAMTLESSKTKTCNYIVGRQIVDGDCALRFARERKSYVTGDRHRGENQQQVITSIIGKLSGSKDYLLKIPAILDIAADSFETSFERDDIVAFLRMQLSGEVNWQVESISVDGAGTYAPTYSMGANLPLYVMEPSPETVAVAQNKINEYLSTAVEAEVETEEPAEENVEE